MNSRRLTLEVSTNTRASIIVNADFPNHPTMYSRREMNDALARVLEIQVKLYGTYDSHEARHELRLTASPVSSLSECLLVDRSRYAEARTSTSAVVAALWVGGFMSTSLGTRGWKVGIRATKFKLCPCCGLSRHSEERVLKNLPGLGRSRRR